MPKEKIVAGDVIKEVRKRIDPQEALEIMGALADVGKAIAACAKDGMTRDERKALGARVKDLAVVIVKALVD
jgi:hypothetical protein